MTRRQYKTDWENKKRARVKQALDLTLSLNPRLVKTSPDKVMETLIQIQSLVGKQKSQKAGIN